MSGENVINQMVTAGDAAPVDTATAIGQAARRIDELAGLLSDAANDREAVKAQLAEQATILDTLKARHAEEQRTSDIQAAKAMAESAMQYAKGLRSPSKAAALGGEFAAKAREAGRLYVPGAFLSAVYHSRSMDASPEQRVAAKAALDAMGSEWLDVPAESEGAPASKAATGLTDAAGGWLIPNAVVDDMVKVGRYQGGAGRLVNRRTGLAGVASVDIPYRSAAPTRAAVIAWGSLKTNVDLAYEGYTATLYTLAKIHDLSKQFVRKSAGAAEADVMDELARAFALGEGYYILRGSGSSEPYGLQTAITNSPATFTSTFSAATTQAGSILSAIATAAGAISARDRTPTGAIVGGAALWTLASQGTDNAGFFLDVTTDPTSPTIRAFGVPVYSDTQLAGTDDLIVGDWGELKVYYGEGYRVDSSDVAGTRWDYNLVGFRGEMEMGLDARPAVYAGAFQFVADIIP